MSSELKNFPPSDLKLQKLRLSGDVPFSMDVLTFAVLIGVFVVLWFLLDSLAVELSEYLKGAFPVSAQADTKSLDESTVLSSRVWKLLALVSKPTLVMLFSVLLLVLLSGALQTRFLFSIWLIKLDFGRFFSFRVPILPGFAYRFLLALGRLLKVVCWIIVSYGILSYVFFELAPRQRLADIPLYQGTSLDQASLSEAKDLSERQSEALPVLLNGVIGASRHEMVSFFAYALAFAFLFAALSRVLVVLSHQHAHRMTRSEVEAEYREMEASSELSNARKDFSMEESS